MAIRVPSPMSVTPSLAVRPTVVFFCQAAAGHGAQHDAAAGDAEDKPEGVGREVVDALVEVRAPCNIGEKVEEDG